MGPACCDPHSSGVSRVCKQERTKKQPVAILSWSLKFDSVVHARADVGGATCTTLLPL